MKSSRLIGPLQLWRSAAGNLPRLDPSGQKLTRRVTPNRFGSGPWTRWWIVWLALPATAPPAHAATCLYVSSYHAGYVWNDGIERGLEQALYCLRRGDTVARLGGDEFTAIFEDIGDRRDVARAAQAILEAVGEPVTLCGRTCKVTASIGITLYPQDATEPQCLIMYADNAMYRAKQQAGDTYGFYAPGVNPIPARPPP